MNLDIEKQRFIVCGASSGFGLAVAKLLLSEGASVVAVARRGDLLKKEFHGSGQQIECIEGDLQNSATLDIIESLFEQDRVHGILFNAGGPPTGTPLQTEMNDWDNAWKLVMRWKIELALRVAPRFTDQGYGRLLFVESQTVKQPLPALVLSNAFRAGVAGFAKSLALEVASSGVTVNILAPGSHETPAIERVISKNSTLWNVSAEVAKKKMEQSIPVGRMGKAEEFASLACWLLSPLSGYVTGQTISHDGGVVAGLFG